MPINYRFHIFTLALLSLSRVLIYGMNKHPQVNFATFLRKPPFDEFITARFPREMIRPGGITIIFIDMRTMIQQSPFFPFPTLPLPLYIPNPYIHNTKQHRKLPVFQMISLDVGHSPDHQTSPSTCTGGFGVGANFDRARSLWPYFQKATGIGTRTRATQPRRVPA